MKLQNWTRIIIMQYSTIIPNQAIKYCYKPLREWIRFNYNKNQWVINNNNNNNQAFSPK